MLIGLAAGSVRGLRGEATTAAATAIVVLTTGYSDDGGMLAARLLDVGIGVAVGMLVNLLVWPPLRDRGAAHQIDVIDDRIGDLLCEIAGGLRAGTPETDDWIERTEELDEDIDEGRRVLGQARESGRLNPRPAKRRRMRATEDFAGVLTASARPWPRRAAWSAPSRSPASSRARWDPAFRDAWLELLRRTGEAVAAPTPSGSPPCAPSSTSSSPSSTPTGELARVRRPDRQPAQHPRVARRRGHRPARRGHHLTPTDGGFARLNA